MKKILGFIAVLGASSAFSPMVISHKANINPSQQELGKLIRKVEEIVANSTTDSEEFETLKETLRKAKETHWGSSKTEEFIKRINELKDDLYDYQNPGYKEAKRILENLVTIAEEAIWDTGNEIKSPRVLDNLINAIAKSRVTLQDATMIRPIKIATIKLRFHLEKYKRWEWNDHKLS